MKGLVERLPQQMLVKLKRIVADKKRRRPREKLTSDTTHHLVMRVQGRIEKLRGVYFSNAHSARCRNDVGQKSATNFETIKLVELEIGVDGRKLQNLIEGGVGTRCFRIVENKSHLCL